MNIEFKNKYENLPEPTRLRIKQFGIGIVFVTLVYLAYSGRTDEIKETVKQNNTNSVVVVEPTNGELFEDDIMDMMRKGNEDFKDEFEKLKKENENLKRMFELEIMQQSQPDNSDANNTENTTFPNSPNSPNEQPTTSIDSTSQEFNDIQLQWVGGIVHEDYPIVEQSNDEADTKKQRIVKLPPSFMDGFLLTGMDASTIEGSGDTPEPMMIRVQAPAVLPNDVKANLEGCFVIAEGYGNLATHRVDAKLVSLSCVDHVGGSVIFEKIKGYVQDGDGKRGIKGQPVHRAGSLIARSMIAGAFQGIGEAITGSAQTTNISALGQTNNTPSGNLGKAALGGGISSGAKDVRNLFLQLAKQSTPVIEVGAAKKISVVITELVELKIQEL